MMGYTPDQWNKAKTLIDLKDYPAPYNNAVAVCADLLADLETLRTENEGLRFKISDIATSMINLAAAKDMKIKHSTEIQTMARELKSLTNPPAAKDGGR